MGGLEASCGCLRAVLERLGETWGSLGLVLGGLGAAWGRSWAFLARSSVILGVSGRGLGRSWGNLGARSWVIFGRSGCGLGRSWCDLRWSGVGLGRGGEVDHKLHDRILCMLPLSSSTVDHELDRGGGHAARSAF